MWAGTTCADTIAAANAAFITAQAGTELAQMWVGWPPRYPGRQDRMTEPFAIEDLRTRRPIPGLAARAADALLPWSSPTFASFGHGLSAIVAVEVALAPRTQP
ncbi:hypothetical protein GCM10023195_77030 [Actinoallomurus liliacearum]|uniref:Uncharacterized protein n=1 Tax=Actinoallomurus liliacearum TaxID=1080073 RepID=A0ABP8TV57_9ACTN